MDESLARRVGREKVLHESDDVLARSFALKDRFPHIHCNPARQELLHCWENVFAETRGKRVLDYGCGRGEATLRILAAGGAVVGIDIAENYVAECRERARKAGYDETQFQFHVMDAHNLALPDATFDIVIGNGILHHLDIELAIKEVWRVLRPGGRAVFQEPLADNPLLILFRRLTPFARTPDEHPLSHYDLERIAHGWQASNRFFGLVCAPAAMLTSLLLRPWPHNPVLSLAYAFERRLRLIRALDTWHQYVLIDLTKPGRA